jgi:hypothetical protein
MKLKVKRFDPKQILAKEFIIKSAVNKLYIIGLSFYPNGSEERYPFHSPVFIIVLQIILLIKFLIPVLLPQKNEIFYVLIGDFSYYFNGTIHLNIAAFFITLLNVSTHLIHLYQYVYGIKPSFLKPLEMIAGLVTPQSIGLTDEKKAHEFVKLTRNLFLACDYLTKLVMPLVAFNLSFWLFAFNYQIKDLILYGIPHTLLFILCSYFNYSSISWQLVYFHLNCYYLKTKIRSINEELKSRINKKSKYHSWEVKYFVKPLDHIYGELNDYNTNYWSKFLFLIWGLLATVINTVLYLTIFAELNLIARMLLTYSSIFFIFIIILVINNASSVAYEANKSYNLFNSYYAKYVSMCSAIRSRVKVKIFGYLSKPIYFLCKKITYDLLSHRFFILKIKLYFDSLDL